MISSITSGKRFFKFMSEKVLSQYQKDYEDGGGGFTPARYGETYLEKCPDGAARILMMGAASGESVKDLAEALNSGEKKLAKGAEMIVVDIRTEAIDSIARLDGKVSGVRVVALKQDAREIAEEFTEIDLVVVDFTFNHLPEKDRLVFLDQGISVLSRGGVMVTVFEETVPPTADRPGYTNFYGQVIRGSNIVLDDGSKLQRNRVDTEVLTNHCQLRGWDWQAETIDPTFNVMALVVRKV